MFTSHYFTKTTLGYKQKKYPRQKQTQKIMFHISQCSWEFSTEIVKKNFIFQMPWGDQQLHNVAKIFKQFVLNLYFLLYYVLFFFIHNFSSVWFDKKSCYILKPCVYFVVKHKKIEMTVYCFIEFHVSQQNKHTLLRLR